MRLPRLWPWRPLLSGRVGALSTKADMTALAHRLFFTLRPDALITKVAHRFGVGIFIANDMTCSGFLDFESRENEWWGFGLHVIHGKVDPGRA